MNKKDKSNNKKKFNKKFFDKKSKDNIARDDNRDDFCSKTKGNNDMAWYSQNKSLVSTSSRLAFGRPLGQKVALGTYSVGQSSTTINKSTGGVPGVMTFKMRSAIGCNPDGVQSIDVAAKSIYSWVRHANSGHANYDSPDLMLYLLAVREIYSACGYLLGTYALINKYEAENRYMPDEVLNGRGIYAPYIRENLADFRFFCSQYFKKVAVLYAPKNFPLFEKAFWIYTNIYKEDKTGKSPIYQYAPQGFYKFNATKYNTGGCLEWTALPNFQSYSAITTYFESLLDPIINNEDMGIMSGDIKKAFDNNVWSVGDFPLDVTIEPIYDSFVLQQMHNTRPLDINNNISLDIVQDNVNNELLWFPSIKASTNYDSLLMDVRGEQSVIDIDSAVPSEEEVMEASQYINTYAPITATPSASYLPRVATYAAITGNTYAIRTDFLIYGCSDYVCSVVTVRRFRNGQFSGISYDNNFMDVLSGNNSASNVYSKLQVLSSFEWAPFQCYSPEMPIFGTLHNYTLVADDVLDNMHETAWLSLLSIPANEHLK